MSLNTLTEQVNLNKKNKNLMEKKRLKNVQKNWFMVQTPENSKNNSYSSQWQLDIRKIPLTTLSLKPFLLSGFKCLFSSFSFTKPDERKRKEETTFSFIKFRRHQLKKKFTFSTFFPIRLFF